MKDFILNNNQKKIINKLNFLKNFYLAGGTALALQLGHRTSKDFDFYSEKDFSSKALYSDFRKKFSKDISKPVFSENTLQFKIGITDLSFFKYPYLLIKPFKEWNNLKLASLEDIAAMKIEAIVGRGTKRDFIDIYYLIKEFGLNKVLNFGQKKYTYLFNKHNTLRALIYFNDAEKKQSRAKLTIYDSKISWGLVKKYLIKEITDYQKEMMKK